MSYGTPADPVGGTVITTAYAVANLLNPIRWLRLMTGNADPPGSSYVVVSDSTTGTTWRKIPADALAAGVALSNLGYTPVNRAGDLGLGGAIGWGTSAYITGTNPNQLFLVSGQLIYLVDAANPGVPAATIDVVNKTFAWGGSLALTTGISASAATLTGALVAASANLSGVLIAASASLSGALSAASAALTGTLTAAGASITKSGPTPSASAYSSGHVIATTPNDNTAPTVGFLRAGVSAASLYESGNRLHVWGADNVHGEVALATGSTITNLGADKVDGADATTTPTAGTIPIADGTGKLDPDWIPASAGIQSGLGAWVPTAAAIPAGWTRYSNLDGRIPVGAGTTFSTTYTENTNYGASWSHSHTDGGVHNHSGAPLSVSGTTSGPAGTNTTGGVGNTSADGSHTHTYGASVAGNTANNSTTATSSDAWVIPSRAVVWITKN